MTEQASTDTYKVDDLDPGENVFRQTGSKAGTQEPVRIVGLGGSLAPSSTSLSALKLALTGAGQSGAAVTLLDIRALNLPMYVPGTRVVPDQVHMLLAAMSEADGFIWSSPQYHGTISGAFKNALDWLDVLEKRDPPHLTNKVVGLVSTAGGTQGVQAINTMEFIVRALRGLAIPLVVPISQARKVFDEAGQVLDPKVETQLYHLGSEVVRVTRQMRNRQSGPSDRANRSARTEVVCSPEQMEVR